MKPVGIIPWTEEFFGAVARRLVAATGGDFTDVLVIFPLRRAARHLCDRLAALPQLPKPLLAPEIVAVGDWAAAIGASFAPTPPVMLDVLDRVAILHDIVRAVAAEAPQPGDFPTDMARFFPWGLELAERMEELFRHNVPGRDLAHLQGQVLPPAAALLSRLGAIHDRYRQRLVAEGLATPGLCLALAAENAREAAARFAGRKVFACGFAVPSGAEKALFAALWRQGDLEMLWHGDPALADPGGRVHFSCLEQKRWLGDLSARAVVIADGRTRRAKAKAKAAPDRPTLVLDADAANLSSKKLRFFEGHDLHAQLKALETCLREAPDLEDTAIVLPDTGLLSPVLHILPRKDVNISMGYPLARSSLARLLETILTLQETALSPGRYHWKELVALLRHPYLKMLRLGEAEPLRGVFHGLEAALRRGGAFVDPFLVEAGEEDAPTPPEVAALARRVLTTCLAAFAAVDTPRALGNAVAGLCELLLDPDHAGDAWERFLIDAECLFRLATAVVPTLTGGRLADAILPRDTLFSLLRRLIADERAPFEAEPLTGLQVLGVLETRLMTFRRVYVLDAVEDKLPGSAPYEPLLPDPLRRLLSLPDTRQRDLVAAYNIYRLFFGAEEITLLYRTGAPGAGLFEDAKPSRSRYVEQLLWEEEKRRGRVLSPGEPPVALVRLPLCPIPEADAAMPVTPAVAARLAAYLENHRLSATFLDTYLACPLRFFYRYLSPLAALAEVAEEGDPAAVGIAAHEALREFFTPYLGRDIDAADIDALALADLFEARLADNPAYQALPADGRLLLAKAGRHRLSAMAAALPRTTPFELETELAASLDVSGRPFLLAGRADRLDRREEGVVIVDYKTGSVPAVPAAAWTDEAFFRRVTDFRDSADDPRLLDEAAGRFPSVQLPLYCWLYGAGRGERPADAAFVELRQDGQEKPLFGPRFEAPARREIIERRVPQLLRFLLRHLTTATAFAPRPDERRCPYCDFRPACGAASR